MIEIESKILNIDIEDAKKRLKKAKAVDFGEKKFEVFLFSVPENLKGSTLRLRKEGDDAVLTFKKVLKSESDGIKRRNEMEVIVSDFEVCMQMLLSLGYQVRQHFSKMRSEYHLDGAEIVIDRYLGSFAVIPPLMEIEADSEAVVIEIAEKLGYSRGDLSTKGLRDFVVEYGLPDLG